eukprot:TRINITY_DN32559_c0_g1_i1.p1 TRINITY_DN32559_c0_g1~~TRINITY_DN32559_c0_g1_i1.p1  ORF type:complete len:581 (+),score=89.35 TRINITY_DN32559_c0_g1_i1:82-1824(+)
MWAGQCRSRLHRPLQLPLLWHPLRFSPDVTRQHVIRVATSVAIADFARKFANSSWLCAKKLNKLHANQRHVARQSSRRDALAVPSEGGVKAHILTACNEYRQETVLLERSALYSGYSFFPLGVGGPWRGVGTKLALYDQALQTLVGTTIAPEEPVMLLDAWDTVILGSAEELHSKLADFGALDPSSGIVVGAADRICAPEYRLAPRMERLYPSTRTPWRYPNSGGFAGTAKAVARFLKALVRGTVGGAFSEVGDDQLRVQTFLLTCADLGTPFPLVLDEDLSLFLGMGEPQCSWDYEQAGTNVAAAASAEAYMAEPPPRILSRITGERPLVAHGCGGNGRWFLADVYRELRLLEHLRISQQDLAGIKYAGLVPPGCEVREEHWVNLAPWDFTFHHFETVRRQELLKEEHALQQESARSINTSASGDAIHVGDIVTLRTHLGYFLQVHETAVVAAPLVARDLLKQTLRIETPSAGPSIGPLRHGDTVYLRTQTGMHLDVQSDDCPDGHGPSVRARWDDHGERQRFIVERFCGEDGEEVSSGDRICLRSHTGRHIEAENVNVRARWEDHGAWQGFIIEKHRR